MTRTYLNTQASIQGDKTKISAANKTIWVHGGKDERLYEQNLNPTWRDSSRHWHLTARETADIIWPVDNKVTWQDPKTCCFNPWYLVKKHGKIQQW